MNQLETFNSHHKHPIMKTLLTLLTFSLLTFLAYSQVPNIDTKCPPTPCQKFLSSQISYNTGSHNSLALRVKTNTDSISLNQHHIDSLSGIFTALDVNVGIMVQTVEDLNDCCNQIDIPWIKDSVDLNSVIIAISKSSYVKYKIEGTTAHVDFLLFVQNISKSLADIDIPIPAIISPVDIEIASGMVKIGGFYEPFVILTTTGQTELTIIRGNNLKWTATNNQFVIVGQLTYEI